MYDRNVIRVCNIDYDYVCVNGMTRILSIGFSFKWRENDYQFLDYNIIISYLRKFNCFLLIGSSSVLRLH